MSWGHATTAIYTDHARRGRKPESMSRQEAGLESAAKERPFSKENQHIQGALRITDMYRRKRRYRSRHDGGGVEAVEAAPDLAERGRRGPAAGDGEEDPLQLGDEAHHPARRRQQQREGQHPDAQLQDQHPLLLPASSSSNPGSSQLQPPPADRFASPPTTRSVLAEIGTKEAGRLRSVPSLWA
ncbi:hypothetical protein C2845_PM10G01960 [Panicum miliaceum]|uniref:Uncharacterized protein n=1 Tax=Panicum miliaceum TaxID=4540 RepID=A0A3L6PJC1_PANMI|nr:hypothetical protein C2845_PM10G01960 [Panicum miliaceum]